jgi:hypothetical protein
MARIPDEAVFSSSEISGQAFKLFVCFCAHRNHTNGLAWPDAATINRETGIHPKYQKELLKQLVGARWAAVEGDGRVRLVKGYGKEENLPAKKTTSPKKPSKRKQSTEENLPDAGDASQADARAGEMEENLPSLEENLPVREENLPPAEENLPEMEENLPSPYKGTGARLEPVIEPVILTSNLNQQDEPALQAAPAAVATNGVKVNPVEVAIAEYELLFLNRFGEKPNVVPGKDKNLLGTLIQRHGLEKILDYLKQYIASDDEFITKAGWTIGVFQTRLNTFLARKRDGPQLSPKTQGNAAIIDDFVSDMRSYGESRR